MSYGMPYMGSKSSIAKWIVDMLPPADTWVEPFAGGCAVTHAAMLSGKYKKFIINDVTDSAKIFKEAINGKFRNETRWISREDFFRLKDSDAYVRLCFSFGNDQKTYCYAKEIEPYKRAFHYAAVFCDYKPFEELGMHITDDKHKSVYERRISIKKKLQLLGMERKSRELQSLESLERLERLQSLERLQVYQMDYREMPIPKSDYLLYCDPPYVKTNGYLSDFNYEEFYEWAKKKNCFVSEYTMPGDFERIAMIKKTSLLAANGRGGKKEEGIWVHKRYADKARYIAIPLFG